MMLFLCGDVMTGRGIDQVLPSPVDPTLHEPYVDDAREYVRLAERANGVIPAPVDFRYVWGDALAELERAGPEARIVNLETSITTSEAWEPKGINYRMHPENVSCLTAAGIDCCVLANNHVLDWGLAGLEETLETLNGVGLGSAGAGRDWEEAWAPGVVRTGRGRVLIFGLGGPDSGVPRSWAATGRRPGVGFVGDWSDAAADEVVAHVGRFRESGDLVVVSVHWGGNWGYAVPRAHRRFAHRLVDSGAVEVIHGHSSHHPRGIEVRRGRPILYGCGDFLNDYEGISGHEEYRADLALMYLITLSTVGLAGFRMVPFRRRRLRLERASGSDASWIAGTLDRESARFGTRVAADGDDTLHVQWDGA
ncbi:MAG TPA: CapA family protein [Longimicrobiales bacterium]|nr:CapA family protein [Longimicrobiales bacterium]